MKAVLCEKLGGPDDLVMRDVPDAPAPGPGEVRVALEARGVSFVDLLMLAGKYQVKPQLPFVVGGEGAGRVLQVGEGVAGLRVGDAVLAGGGCVEQITVPAARVTKLPAHVDLGIAASFRTNYATALYGMQRARLQAGETLLVHGAAGGVGLAAVDVGKLMGATVIGTASTAAKLDAVREMGADHLVDYAGGFRDRVKDLTGGRGADVIVDPVGGDVFDESMRCIAPLGRILIIGFTSGRPALAKTNHVLIKEAELIGMTIGTLAAKNPQWAQRNQAVLHGWLVAGRIRPRVSHRLPLSETSAALKLVERREVIGKAVVVND